MNQSVSNTEDMLDSRDIIRRIEELEACGELDEEKAELYALKLLAQRVKSYSDDWEDGVTLIRDSYFVEYTKERCMDIGVLPKDIPPYLAIDWNKTAKNIRSDYFTINYGGVIYWVGQ